MKLYFKILALDVNASFEDVKKSYKNLLKAYHPDIIGSNEFIEKFYQTQIAYKKIELFYLNKEKNSTKDSFDLNTIKSDNFKKLDEDDYKSIFWEENLTDVRNHFDFEDKLSEILVDNLTYKTLSLKYIKELKKGDYTLESDGFYILVQLSILNIAKQTIILNYSDFKLYDRECNIYESLYKELEFLNLQSNKLFFRKECKPKLKTEGFLLFEVPEQKQYFIKLYGGVKDDLPSYEYKIVPLKFSFP
jgi:hypothetical protein